MEKGQEQPHGLFPDLSCLFPLFRPFLHPFFTILVKNRKKSCQNLEERETKEKHSFPFLSLSYFLPFLSSHMPNDYTQILANQLIGTLGIISPQAT